MQISKTIILIPSRLKSRRLPNKPLLKIKGISMINHVYHKAVKASLGEVFVATGDKKIYQEVIKNGGNCILTKKKHKTGTDRIYEALNKIKSKKYKYIINLQGDEPMIDINDLRNLNSKITSKNLDMGTLASKISLKKKIYNKNIVKVQTEKNLLKNKISKANAFFRNSTKSKNIYHHIGVYIYKRQVLKKFVLLKQTQKEKKNNLEQLRAIENNIKIHVVLAKSTPIGVDTYQDYKKIKNLFKKIH